MGDLPTPTVRNPEDLPVPEQTSAAGGGGRDDRDAVLVPLDQWTRILNQLGNLHEAGQQLGDARERAAKAETESTFLRERLKEMRSRLDEIDQASEIAEPEPSFGVWFLRRRLERRKGR